MASSSLRKAVGIRPMSADDLDAVDTVLRLAFGTVRGLPDPAAAFGDRDLARTRFRASPDSAWVAELEGKVVGSVFATRWGSFAFLGPLSVRPDLWNRGIGHRLLEPVVAAFERWGVLQAGLFTFASSPKHLGLYQRHGFWPRSLVVVSAKAAESNAQRHTLLSDESTFDEALDEIRLLTDTVWPGLDLSREIAAVQALGLGDTVLVRRDGTLEGMAVCQCGSGTEAGSDTCYVKFAASRAGEGAGAAFDRLLDACESFASVSGLGRVVAGVNTERLEAYRRLLGRGYRAELVGVSMFLPSEPHFVAAEQYVLDDLR